MATLLPSLPVLLLVLLLAPQIISAQEQLRGSNEAAASRRSLVTKRTLLVTLRNRSGRTIFLPTFMIRHQYSSNYKDLITFWKEGEPMFLQDGQSKTSTMGVNFNTGFLTTGTDHWTLFWADSNNRQYISVPQWAAILKFLSEEYNGALLDGLNMAIGKIFATGVGAPGSGYLVKQVMGRIQNFIVQASTKSGLTKQCMLTSSDGKSGRPVTIEIQTTGSDGKGNLRIIPPVSSNCGCNSFVVN